MTSTPRLPARQTSHEAGRRHNEKSFSWSVTKVAIESIMPSQHHPPRPDESAIPRRCCAWDPGGRAAARQPLEAASRRTSASRLPGDGLSKAALRRLKVEQLWETGQTNPVRMELVARAGRFSRRRPADDKRREPLFVMGYLDPGCSRLGRISARRECRSCYREEVATRLALITAPPPVTIDRAHVRHDEDFYPIRLEPYLMAAARAHPTHRAAEQLCRTRIDHLASVQATSARRNPDRPARRCSRRRMRLLWAIRLRSASASPLLLKCLWTPGRRSTASSLLRRSPMPT